MQTSQEIKELAIALSKAQGEIDNASKNSTNPHFGKDYADLAAVWSAIRASFSKNGLSIIQTPIINYEGTVRVGVTTRMLHSSGQWIEETLMLTPDRIDPQRCGSAITYARRYALAAFAGIAQEDDDANAASGNTENKGKPALPQAPKNPPVPPKTPPAPPAPPADNKKSEADKAQEAAAAALPTGANTGALPFADAGSKYNMEKIKAVVNDDLKKLFGKLQMKSAEIVEYWNAFDGDQEAIKNAIESAQKEAGK